MKNKIKVMLVGVVLSASVSTVVLASNVYVDALKGIYDLFFKPDEFWKIDVDVYPYDDSVYVDNAVYTESGSYGFEPTVETLQNGLNMFLPWSTAHKLTCPDTKFFRDMSINTPEDAFVNYTSLSGELVSMKSFNVNVGVPFDFSAHKHGWLTRQLRDTYYAWSFGDGIRRFNNKKQDNVAPHVWKSLGKNILSSMVYTEGYYIGSSVTFGVGDNNWSFSSGATDLELEGCDVAEINVIENNAPKPRVSIKRREDIITGSQTITFSSAGSIDPDGNPLTFSWRFNDQVKSGTQATFHVSRVTSWSSDGNSKNRIYLTASDGGKSDTVSFTFYTTDCVTDCNIFRGL